VIPRDELAGWLRLLDTPEVGRESARRLLAAFASPQAVFDAPVAARRTVIGPVAAEALSEPRPHACTLTDTTLQWLASARDVPRHVITLGDPLYPAALLDTADPPLLLYAEGNAQLLQTPALAIVGSRNPTAQGRDNARALAAALSAAGLTVISGLALGIDGAAHEGALQGPGSTIAVVGTGLDIVYPRRHRDLVERIVRHGLMLSEYSLGTPPLPPHFPLRNRIIAGLRLGTLVVEAALRSGSLITARLASEAGRDVFAVPGSIHSPLARGCHALIKQGAKLVDDARDIIDELRIATPAGHDSAPSPVPVRGDVLLDALGFDPVSLDALVARTGWAPQDLSTRLFTLELDGQVARLPGQLFQRVLAG